MGLFQHMTFRQQSFQHGHFIMGIFRHWYILDPQTFLQPWTFQHGEFLAQGHFGTKTLKHWDIFGTVDGSGMLHYGKSPCQNVPVMKWPCSCQNFRCRNKPKNLCLRAFCQDLELQEQIEKRLSIIICTEEMAIVC